MEGTFNGWGDIGAAPDYGAWGERYDLTANCSDQFAWAGAQLRLAEAGSGLDTMRSAGASWDAQSANHPTSVITAPRNTAGAYFRAAYWLGVTARIGVGNNIPQAAISRLTSKGANAALKGTALCTLHAPSESTSAIQAILRAAEVEVERAVAAGIPAWKVRAILEYLGSQQDPSSIAFTQETRSQADVTTVIGGGVRGTAADIGKGLQTIGDVTKAPFDAVAWLYKYGPWILVGVVALSGTAFAVKNVRQRRAIEGT